MIIYQLKYQKFGLNFCQPNFDLKSCQLRSQFTKIEIYKFNSIWDWWKPKYLPEFEIYAIPNTDLIWQYDVCCVSKHSQINDYKYWV